METDKMGRTVVAAKIEHIGDLLNVEAGILPADQVRRLEVNDALADTGSTYLAMPRRLIQQLGFTKPVSTSRVRTTRGTATANIFGPVRLTVMDRFCTVDVTEVDDDCPVLIGQVPLELLDLVVDPRGQRLIGNPAHGGEHMIEMYCMSDASR
jgi:predicted aspartyl protease